MNLDYMENLIVGSVEEDVKVNRLSANVCNMARFYIPILLFLFMKKHNNSRMNMSFLLRLSVHKGSLDNLLEL